jgi:hypothetical protein
VKASLYSIYTCIIDDGGDENEGTGCDLLGVIPCGNVRIGPGLDEQRVIVVIKSLTA